MEILYIKNPFQSLNKRIESVTVRKGENIFLQLSQFSKLMLSFSRQINYFVAISCYADPERQLCLRTVKTDARKWNNSTKYLQVDILKIKFK